MKKNTTGTSLTIPEEYRLRTVLDELKANNDITTKHKKQLIRQQYDLLVDSFKEQGRIALEIEKEKLGKQQLLINKAIAVQTENMTNLIRQEYIRAVAPLTKEIEIEQLEMLYDFGEKIQIYQDKLQSCKLKPKFKKELIKISDESFDRVKEKLTQLTLDALAKAEKQPI